MQGTQGVWTKFEIKRKAAPGHFQNGGQQRPQRDFDTLFEKLESNLAFANDDAFMNELKANIKTPEQWARLVKLYCDSFKRIYSLIQDSFPPYSK